MIIKFILTFGGLNVPEHCVECESFTVISIGFLLIYDNEYYLQVYVHIVRIKRCLYCASNIADKQMIDYRDDNLFETDEDLFN